MSLLEPWLEEHRPEGVPENLRVYREREGGRSAVFSGLTETVKGHFVKIESLQRMGFERAAAVLEAKLPTRASVRSGDMGEILATEYVRERTDFRVPINRLRYKDDRDTTMRGDDTVGFRRLDGRIQVLKVEAKSRARLSKDVVRDACDALKRHSSRPNPSSLAFIAGILREQDRDEEAEQVESVLERRVAERDLEHLVFTLSGNDPVPVLKQHARSMIRRSLVGIRIPDHQVFIRNVFEALDGAAA
jgi:hypothetical protein